MSFNNVQTETKPLQTESTQTQALQTTQAEAQTTQTQAEAQTTQTQAKAHKQTGNTIVNFENVKVTTMTAVAILEGDIVIESVFPLLPITKLKLNDNIRSKKKFKIPWPGKEFSGAIFAAKYAGITRGIVKTVKKSFRNAISLDICTSSKNISAKLTKNKIQLTGPNSKELAWETSQYLVDHLLKIQKELDYMNSHVRERDEIIKWLIEETKGNIFIINEETQEIIELQEGELIRNSVVYDKTGKVKYNYKEIEFKWEAGDNINPDNIVVNKYGQPYFRSLTKLEKKQGMIDYPIMQIGEIVKIRNEVGSVPMDDRGNKFGKVCRVPLRVVEVVSVKYPDYIMKSLSENKGIRFPKNINTRIGNFLIKYIQDYPYHHIFVDFLENVRQIVRVFLPKEVENNDKIEGIEGNEGNDKIEGKEGNDKNIVSTTTSKDISLHSINIAMINYSYSLQMNVDRWRLAELIDGYEGFNARYNNTTDHAVTITLPYDKDQTETIKRKGQPIISWMVYRSGIVTQSGPSPDIMKPMYYKFMNFIQSVKDEIAIKDGKPFGIKFTPVS